MEHQKAKEALAKLRQEEFLNAKPSGQIRMAVEDILALKQREKNISFNMSLWLSRFDDENCAVCVAGAVMLNRFDLKDDKLTTSNETGVRTNVDGQRNEIVLTIPSTITPDARAFAALNLVRFGHLDAAARVWDCARPIDFRRYELDTQAFNIDFEGSITELLHRADLFEEVGA